VCDRAIKSEGEGGSMMVSGQTTQTRRTAGEILRFLDRMMDAIVRVDLGDSGVAQLTLLELRTLMVLGGARRPMTIREIALEGETSIAQSGQATGRLRSRGLAERRGGGRGDDRAFSLTRRGGQLLGSLEAGRQSAVEMLISSLTPSDRLRLEGAAHLLGSDLDRLGAGVLAA
jgi:DNA-binding MarR family transcriptional regulator